MASAAAYRRRRLSVAMTATSVLLVAGVVLGRLGAGPLASSETSLSRDRDLIAQSSYVVKAGDTDWSIARSFNEGGDIRPLVGFLAAQHPGTPLQVGEVLQLP